MIPGSKSGTSLGYREGIAESLQCAECRTEGAVGHHVAGPLTELTRMANPALLRVGEIYRLQRLKRSGIFQENCKRFELLECNVNTRVDQLLGYRTLSVGRRLALNIAPGSYDAFSIIAMTQETKFVPVNTRGQVRWKPCAAAISARPLNPCFRSATTGYRTYVARRNWKTVHFCYPVPIIIGLGCG